jgi:hypothetical protein
LQPPPPANAENLHAGVDLERSATLQILAMRNQNSDPAPPAWSEPKSIYTHPAMLLGRGGWPWH